MDALRWCPIIILKQWNVKGFCFRFGCVFNVFICMVVHNEPVRCVVWCFHFSACVCVSVGFISNWSWNKNSILWNDLKYFVMVVSVVFYQFRNLLWKIGYIADDLKQIRYAFRVAVWSSNIMFLIQRRWVLLKCSRKVSIGSCAQMMTSSAYHRGKCPIRNFVVRRCVLTVHDWFLR